MVSREWNISYNSGPERSQDDKYAVPVRARDLHNEHATLADDYTCT